MSTESCTCLEEDKELGLSLSLWCFPEGFAELFRFYFSSWKEILKYLLTLALFHWKRWVNCLRLLFRSGHSRRQTDRQRQQVHTYHGKFHAVMGDWGRQVSRSNLVLWQTPDRLPGNMATGCSDCLKAGSPSDRCPCSFSNSDLVTLTSICI